MITAPDQMSESVDDKPVASNNIGNLIAIVLILLSIVVIGAQIFTQRNQSMPTAGSNSAEKTDLIETGSDRAEGNISVFTHPAFPKLKLTHDFSWEIKSQKTNLTLNNTPAEAIVVTASKDNTVITIKVTPRPIGQVHTQCFSKNEKQFETVSSSVIRTISAAGGDYWQSIATMVKSADPVKFNALIATLTPLDSACLKTNDCNLCYTSMNQETGLTSTTYPIPEELKNPDSPDNATYKATVSVSVDQSDPNPELLKEADQLVDQLVHTL